MKKTFITTLLMVLTISLVHAQNALKRVYNETIVPCKKTTALVYAVVFSAFM